MVSLAGSSLMDPGVNINSLQQLMLSINHQYKCSPGTMLLLPHPYGNFSSTHGDFSNFPSTHSDFGNFPSTHGDFGNFPSTHGDFGNFPLTNGDFGNFPSTHGDFPSHSTH
jgi:hypothetical protein